MYSQLGSFRHYPPFIHLRSKRRRVASGRVQREVIEFGRRDLTQPHPTSAKKNTGTLVEPKELGTTLHLRYYFITLSSRIPYPVNLPNPIARQVILGDFPYNNG